MFNSSGSFDLDAFRESAKKQMRGDAIDNIVDVRKAFMVKLEGLRYKLSKEYQEQLREKYGDDIVGLAAENARLRSEYEQLKEALNDTSCWFGPERQFDIDFF